MQGSGPGVVIEGNQNGPVITFNSGETRSAVLQNVTISNGSALGGISGGGISISGASPTIQNSTISGNLQCGIGVYDGAPAILNNEINTTMLGLYIPGCLAAVIADAYGGGIVMYGPSNDGLETQIIGNTIENNQVRYGAGGINVVSAGLPLIENNVIRNNYTNDRGAGINVVGDTAPLIVQNLIYGNVINPTIPVPNDNVGAGLSVDVGAGQFDSAYVLVVNNTIVENQLLIYPHALTQGSQFFADGQTQRIQLFNNLIVGTTSQAPIECIPDSVPSNPPPTFVANDVYDLGNPGAALYGDVCTDQTGISGNISADPLFATDATDAHPYQLILASPAVDAGDNQAPSLSLLDILGQPRIQNAKGLSTSIVDMGVYEYAGVLGPPPPPANFTLVVSPSSATIQQGQSPTFSVAITPSGTNLGAVTLTCTGLPANTSCTFTPSLLAFISTGQQSSVLSVTIGTAVATASRAHRIDGNLSRTLTGLTQVPFLLGFRRRRRGRNLLAGRHLLAPVCILCIALGLSGCGKDTYVVYTPPQTYSFAVQATAVNSGLSKQAAVTLTIDQ